MAEKLVSVLMAYYDGKKYFEKAIKSVSEQTYKNIEIIVVDDASTEDGNKEFFEELHQKYDFRYFRNAVNMGASKSLDNIFKESKGEYIAYLSQDDIWVKDKLEYQISRMEKEGLDVIFNNSARIYGEDDSNPIPSSTELIDNLLKNRADFMRYMYTHDDMPGNCLIQGACFKRKVIEETSWARHYFILDDWPLTTLFWRDYNTVFDKKISFYYRIHKQNTHKLYWKWTAPRLQVVMELAPEEYKAEGIRFIWQSFLSELYEDNPFFGNKFSLHPSWINFNKKKIKNPIDYIQYKIVKVFFKILTKKGIIE